MKLPAHICGHYNALNGHKGPDTVAATGTGISYVKVTCYKEREGHDMPVCTMAL